jgi:hypothetical protein
MKILIDNLIENFINDLNFEKIPQEIDIVLEGGAFNGSYELGIMMYIKKLEKMNKIKVRRISGASVGSVLGFAYIIDELELINELSNKLLKLFKKNFNFFEFRKLLYSVADNMNKDDYKKFKNRFYLTYFDSKNKKQIVKKKYKSNYDLVNQIVKSSYVPYLMDGNISYKGNIDGGYPYIFTKNKNKLNRKTLYINVTSLKYIMRSISVKNENNGNMRLIDGIMDINNFLTSNKSTIFCSYVDDWKTYDFFVIRTKEMILVLILLIISVMSRIIKIIPKAVKHHKYYIWSTKIISRLSYDILSRIIN